MGDTVLSLNDAPVLPYKFLKLPLVQQFGGGIRENVRIQLIGRSFEVAKSFSFRFACGTGKGDEAPLVFTSDFHGRVKLSTRNYTTASILWRESNEVISTTYFAPATDFHISILCRRESFEIRFGEEVHQYRHRIAFYTARFLIIEGDINLQEMPVSGLIIGEEMRRLSAEVKLPGEGAGEKKVEVVGVPVYAYPFKMMIDFTTAGGDIAFHFNPRFSDGVVVRNNLISNEWKAEERSLLVPFPFVYGVTFKLVFTIEKGKFSVEMNGLPLCEFERLTPGVVDKMVIHGSVAITKASCMN